MASVHPPPGGCRCPAARESSWALAAAKRLGVRWLGGKGLTPLWRPTNAQARHTVRDSAAKRRKRLKNSRLLRFLRFFAAIPVVL